MLEDAQLLEALGELERRRLERGVPEERVAAEAVEADVAARAKPQAVAVGSWAELERLNAAERLSSVDTSARLTADERALLGALRAFEGGPGQGRVTQQSAFMPALYAWDAWGNWIMISPGGYMTQFHYQEGAPSPALLSAEKKGSVLGLGGSYDRLTAYEAMQEMQSGRPVRVRTAAGNEHVIGSLAELQELAQFERG